MFDSQPELSSGEQIARPPLSTVHSAHGTRTDLLHHGKTTPTGKRAETAPVVLCPDSPSSTTKLRGSNSLRQESQSTNANNKAVGRMKRSETFETGTGTGTGSGTGKRPPLARVPSTPTRYMEMLLHLDEIPRLYNILASLGTWIILAGFLVVPGTFTTFKESKAFQEADNADGGDDAGTEVTHAIVHSIANIGLLWLSGSFCVAGTLVCLWLWLRWRHNYVWLINKIFMYVYRACEPAPSTYTQYPLGQITITSLSPGHI